jgi:2-methylisocitrate lyase-like PEP mutase family enzyme
LLAHLGFEALATTSADHAFSIGQRDSTIDRDGVIAYVSAIAAATDLPVSAVLENRFGDTPEIVAETIGWTAAAGAVGGSIEDTSGRANGVPYPLGHAVERSESSRNSTISFPNSVRSIIDKYSTIQD